MNIQHFGSVLPVPDLSAAVSAWSALLGTLPRFVDGDSWAQFEVAGGRMALAGADRDSDLAGVMVKVDDLDEARRRAADLGLEVGPVREGPHETRCSVIGPGGWPILIYSAKV
jgi:hypothetical protein